MSSTQTQQTIQTTIRAQGRTRGEVLTLLDMVTLLATRIGSRTGVTVVLSLEQPQLAWGHALPPSSSLFAPRPALRTFSNMSSSGSGQSVPETTHQRRKPPKGWRPAEVPIPFTGWYLAFRIDVKATLPFLREEDTAAFRQRSKIYVGYLETVSDTLVAAHLCTLCLSVLSSAAFSTRIGQSILALLLFSRQLCPRMRSGSGQPIWQSQCHRTLKL
jgi:hypothetical protein